jgi:hypothetical protein
MREERGEDAGWIAKLQDGLNERARRKQPVKAG